MIAIIAGSARGRRLKTLPGEATRPTSAKVRAALFSILQAWVPDAAWLDLFAGSGAVGLEAISRGAARAVLVEQAAGAASVIRENIQTLGFAQATLQPTSVEAALKRLGPEPFDVVFMDPPYALDPAPVAQAVLDAGLLASFGRLVIEHRKDRALPEAFAAEGARIVLIKRACYSESCLSIYGPAHEA